MAGKPRRMSQVKQILRIHQQGKGIKTIAKTLFISKNTFRGYFRKAKKNTLAVEAYIINYIKLHKTILFIRYLHTPEF